jgi:endoglucanase
VGRAAGLETEARFGQDWLARAWDPTTGTMYLQVGIGSGNTAGTFNGDHDLWRLPEVDDTLAGRENRYLRSRPAFRANDPGTRLPPNLAGRMAAAFALAAQVDAADDPVRARRELAMAASIFRRAKTANVTEADVVTALPHAFYPESSWRDDLEWGAAELALAGRRLAIRGPRLAARQCPLGRVIHRSRGGPRHPQPLRHVGRCARGLVRAMRAARR